MTKKYLKYIIDKISNMLRTKIHNNKRVIIGLAIMDLIFIILPCVYVIILSDKFIEFGNENTYFDFLNIFLQ
ncbi:MAG: hypothetical protein J6M39_01410 [Lachnospiraceae bacterium]|nr:hypothetical protein [Clostridia bacterium]MBP3200297.1 hypothetical protein [Lachnospiraceae bacterium]